MSLTVNAVPETLTRERFVEWLAQIGLDPTLTRSLKVHREAIEAEVYALNDKGEKFIVSRLDADAEIATHIVYIPIVDPES